MQISGLGRPTYSSFTSAATTPAPTRRFSFASVDGQAWVRMADDADALRSSVIDLRRMLSKINPNRYVGGSSETRQVVGTASTASDQLGIDFIGARATLRSTERVLTEPPPFGPVEGDWHGGTTATATVSGRYTGSASETYTVVVDRVRSDETRFELLDSAGDRVRRFTVDDDEYGEAFRLDEGLEVTFQAGNFEEGDTFTFTATPAEPLDYDPDVAFDAPADLDGDFVIENGSFEVNGTEIAVSVNDTLNDVLQRITALTDVEATFDAESQRVVLRNKETGDLDVKVRKDDTGFLSAFKLDGATLERGGEADPDEQMRRIAAFSGIDDGTITINGTAVAIDTTNSLNDTLQAINASGAGVRAEITDRQVTITSLTQGDAITLADDGSNFFAVLGIDTGSVDAPITTITEGGRRRPAGAYGATAREISQLVMEIGERIASIMSTDAEGTVARAASGRVAKQSRDLVMKAFGIEGSPTQFTVGGLRFDFTAGATTLFDTSSDARRDLSKALGSDIRAFHAGMMDDVSGSDSSFLEQLESMADQLFTQARGSIDLRI